MTTKFRAAHIAAIALAAFAALASMTACKPSAKAQASRSGGGAAPPAVAVVWTEAVLKDVPVEIKAIGRVEAFSTVAVKAQVTGEIMSVGFREGQDVKRGDILFMIDPQPYEIDLKQAEALLERDKALLKEAESDARRYADLAAKEYVTREQYDKLVSTRDTLLASIKGDEAAIANARLQLDRCAVRSPIDGRTGSLLIYRGNLVRATDSAPAVIINQIAPVRVVFSVPEQNLPRIREYRAQSELAVQALLDNGNPPAEGTLSFIDNAIDAATGTIDLKAEFPNRDRRLWPGQFVNIVLTLAVQKNAVVVPSQAVQSGQAGLYVFVVKDDMTVEMKHPKVDRTVGNETVISEGLEAGEKVVVDGHLQLVPGARVQAKPAK